MATLRSALTPVCERLSLTALRCIEEEEPEWTSLFSDAMAGCASGTPSGLHLKHRAWPAQRGLCSRQRLQNGLESFLQGAVAVPRKLDKPMSRANSRGVSLASTVAKVYAKVLNSALEAAFYPLMLDHAGCISKTVLVFHRLASTTTLLRNSESSLL